MLVDDGEAEAIALARERGSKIVLDDRQARLVGSNLGLAIIGTVGVLVKAKHSGIISVLKPVLDDLEANGFYLSSTLKEEALRLVGE
jgi:predicted nucleic acid-binding protein